MMCIFTKISNTLCKVILNKKSQKSDRVQQMDFINSSNLADRQLKQVIYTSSKSDYLSGDSNR